MEHLRLERTDGILTLVLARGKANALNAAMVAEIGDALRQAEADDHVTSLVLQSASDKVFSGGFDVGEVFAYDDDTMRDFFGSFLNVLETLRLLPKPVVAAVTGHAYAGGALLALACDARVLADGPFGFAVNEVDLGIVLPSRSLGALVAAYGPSSMRRLLAGGEVLSPGEAWRLGVATEVVEPALVRDRARARAAALGAKPPLAFAAHKRTLSAPYASPLSFVARLEAVDEFMSFWSGPESRGRRQALVESMRKS